jgi:hypothetical protein
MSASPSERRQSVEAFLRKHTTEEARVPRHQLVLLGGNPLPVRVAAEALGAEVVHLAFTPEVADQVAPLDAQLRDLGVSVQPWPLERASHAEEVWALVRRVRESLGREPLGLHYTGGTKVMAAEAVQAWAETQSPRHWRSYLDGSKDALRFAGVPEGLDVGPIDVTLEKMLELHGRQVKSKQVVPASVVPGLAALVAKTWCEERQDELLKRLPPHALATTQIPFGAIRQDSPEYGVDAGSEVAIEWRPVKGKICRGWKLGPALEWLGADLALGQLSGRKHEDAARYAVSGWLEDVVFERVKALGHLQEVWNSVFVRDASGAEFELDLVARRGHRLFVVSCTIDGSKHAKLKAFEAMQHAQQVGGDFARYGLFTLAQDERVLTDISRDIATHWQTPVVPRVFGLTHLRGEEGFTHVAKGQPRAERFERAFDGWT